MLGFGGLVLAAVFVVLMLGLWSARENTVSLTRKLAEAVLDDVQSAIEQRLTPAEAAVAYLGSRIEAGQIKLEGDDLAQALSSALAGLPQVGALIFLNEAANGILVIRGDENTQVRAVAYGQSPEILRQFETAKSRHRVHWECVLRAPDDTRTGLNVRKAIRIDGRFAGILVASVTISQLSAMLAAETLAMDGEAFVLYDQRFVLAHRRLAKGYNNASLEQPLSLVKNFGDPILAAYVNPNLGQDYGGRMSREMGVQIVGTADGQAYPLVARRLNWFGVVPWEIGVYFRDDAVEAEFNRVMAASIAGLVALLLSLVLAWLPSRHISQPLKALARAAGNVRDLSLDNYSPLPASRIKEMDDADLAFNNMITSLRWFETYVPRSLVRRLMRQGEGVLERSEQRELTVLFTDIVDFTAASENMAVAETAALLNEHFAQVGGCIEAEGGTIDKFIGDSVMAFWGAPEEQPDHAARACRTALAIRAAVEDGNKTKPGTPLRLRVGIHTGPVIVGNIGAPQRMNYTIIGDSVNIAHRLEQLGHALGDPKSAVTILLSRATHDAAGIAGADDLGPQHIRGRREVLAVYRL